MPAPPASLAEFHSRIAVMAPGLPRRLRQCAEYLAANADRIAVSTVAELARRAEVPPSAVMRFCQILGFSGFSEMQKLFRAAYAPGFPDYATRLANLRSGPASSPATLLAAFVQAGRASLEALAGACDAAALGQGADLLARAQTVHVIGLRRAHPVASYLAYMLENMRISVVQQGGADPDAAPVPGDVLVAISMAPYAAETLDLARRAAASGVPVVAVTDHLASPLAPLAAAVITVAEVDFGAFRSLSATLAVAMTLAVAAASAREGKKDLA